MRWFFFHRKKCVIETGAFSCLADTPFDGMFLKYFFSHLPISETVELPDVCFFCRLPLSYPMMFLWSSQLPFSSCSIPSWSCKLHHKNLRQDVQPRHPVQAWWCVFLWRMRRVVPMKCWTIPKNHKKDGFLSHQILGAALLLLSSHPLLGGSSHLVSGLVHPSYKWTLPPLIPWK